jgi:hypothetical protein
MSNFTPSLFQKRNKRGLEMSFAWLFGIIIGASILFFAIYLVATMIGNEDELQGAKTSNEIGILLNPLETGFESSKSSSFSMPVETRIRNVCDSYGTFGNQLISVSQKNLGKWSKTDIEVGFANKYIFSDREIEGKAFFIFSKPFNFPYKVSDVIYMTSAKKNYCFALNEGNREEEEIKDELTNLNQGNLFVEEEDFPEDCTEICFSGNCDIKVNLDGNYVEKEEDKLYFEGDALMFAAIFGEAKNYECTLKRLMLRAKELATLYEAKSNLIATNNCNSNLNLIGFSNSLNSFEDSADFSLVTSIANELENENRRAICKLW